MRRGRGEPCETGARRELACTLSFVPPGSAGGWTRGKPPPPPPTPAPRAPLSPRSPPGLCQQVSRTIPASARANNCERVRIHAVDSCVSLVALRRRDSSGIGVLGRDRARSSSSSSSSSSFWLANTPTRRWCTGLEARGTGFFVPRSSEHLLYNWGSRRHAVQRGTCQRASAGALMLSLTSHRRQETPCSSRTNAGDTFTSDELATVEQLLEVAPQERAELDRGGTLSESDGNGRGEAEGVAAAAPAATAPAATEGMDRQRARLIQDARSSTRAVHGGERAKGGKKAKATADSLTTPIVQSSTFTFRNTRECIQYNLGKYSSFEYGRYGNPTTRAAEEKLIDLECGNLAQQDAHPDSAVYDALLSASGMNAVTTMLFALFALDNADVRGAGLGTTVSEKGTGGCLITTTDCYRRTRQFIEEMMPRLNVRVVIMDPSDLALLGSTLREIRESTDGAITQQRVVFFSESPTNPLLRLVDVPRIVALARQYDMMVCIDSTFATPINHRPLELGADLVLHSATKYLGGHNDILAGALIGRAELIAKVRRAHGILGGVIDPHTSYLLLRGLKTLKIRVDAHNQNAAALAHRLANDERIACVHWPGLPEHPDYHLGRRLHEAYAQFRAADGGCGFGGVLSFELRGHLRGGADDPYGAETFRRTGKFIDALRIPYIGPSLGGTETLVEQVCIMGYFDQPLWRRRRLGITCGLVRFSCGIEDAEDIVQDVMHALDVAFEDTYA